MRYGLRTDERQWLIYGDEKVGALARGLEAMALHIAGGPLRRHRHEGVRLIGVYMQRIAKGRIDEMHRNGGAQEIVAEHLADIFEWLGREQAGVHLPPPEGLKEIHALAFHADRRAANAGIQGPGVHREAVRGD